MWFQRLRTALELGRTVVELNERLTALEGNFDILDRAVKRESARVRAENSRTRRRDLEESTAPGEELKIVTSKSAIGGVMRRPMGSST
jgi:hypothetical protein